MNSIPAGGLETAPILAENQQPGSPEHRFQSVISLDAVRIEVYKRTGKLIAEFLKIHNCEPSWVRVSFDLVYKAGAPAFKDPCSIHGLVFRTALEYTNRIEVGNSVMEDVKEQSDAIVWKNFPDNA